jgi:DNA-binding XRE family transcriptional regulator
MKTIAGRARTSEPSAMEWARSRRADPAHQEAIEALMAASDLEQDLIALREQRGLTQVQLAERSGVKQPTISMIESGKVRNLELRTLVRLAAALGARVKISFEMTKTRGRKAVAMA